MGTFEAGTQGAFRFEVRAIVARPPAARRGARHPHRRRLRARLAAVGLARAASTGCCMSGHPNLQVSVHGTEPGEPGAAGGGNATAANRIVNAIPAVCAAPPGPLKPARSPADLWGCAAAIRVDAEEDGPMPLQGRTLDAPADVTDLLQAGLDRRPRRRRDRLARRPDDLARARRREHAARRRLPPARPAAGRPGRVADAEPDQPGRPLPRVLQGRARRDAAQLPLRDARDRPHARGQRRVGAGRCTSSAADDIAATRLGRRSRSASSRTAIPSGEVWSTTRRSKRSCDRGRRRRARPRPTPDAPGRDLLHVGEHRAGEGRDPQLRDARAG